MNKIILLLIVVFALSANSNAQCGFTNPPYVAIYESYDLNNDGLDDVSFGMYAQGGFRYGKIFGRNGAKIETTQNGNLISFNENDPIGGGYSSDSATIDSTGFPSAVRKFIGLKIMQNNQLCLAWMYLSYNTMLSPSINFYGAPNSGGATHCYVSSPAMLLRSGRAGESTAIESAPPFRATISQTVNQIKIETNGNQLFDVAIIDLLGHTLLETKNVNDVVYLSTEHFHNQNVFVIVSPQDNKISRAVSRVFIN